MPTPPDIPGVPDQYQWIVYLTGLIAAVYSGLRALSAGRKEAERMRPEADVIVQGGSFVDMKPIREMNEHLAHLVSHTAALAIEQRRTADAVISIEKLMRDEADGDRMSKEVDRLLEDKIRELRSAETHLPGPRRR